MVFRIKSSSLYLDFNKVPAMWPSSPPHFCTHYTCCTRRFFNMPSTFLVSAFAPTAVPMLGLSFPLACVWLDSSCHSGLSRDLPWLQYHMASDHSLGSNYFISLHVIVQLITIILHFFVFIYVCLFLILDFPRCRD